MSIVNRNMARKVVGGRMLFVPPAHVIHDTGPIALCQVIITGEGELCLHPIHSERERRNHAAECASKHASAINAYRKRTHPDIMRAWDPEFEQWIGKHREAVLAGRMTV